MMWQRVLATSAILLAAAIAVAADEAQPEAPGPYAQWENGPGKDASCFPLAVWAQEPRDAAAYKKAGINLYIGLEGPTDIALAELKKAGMPVICEQNSGTLRHKDDSIIVGWMHADEPDNAQAVPGSKGYGPPVLPAKIIAEYEAYRKADPSRPVLLNLGRCVASDDLPDRDGRSHHPEDYPEYLKGCDIGSFDIYPVAHTSPPYAGKLDFVGRGVERLIKWTDGRKPIWNCMECTRIHGEDKPTPKQVKAEVWIGLVNGSQGIIYFCHQFLPREDDRALLDDAEMLAAVGAINTEVTELAPALNSPAVKDALKVESSNAEVPLATMVKKQGGATYVFAVTLKPGETQGVFTLEGLPAGAQVEVLGEHRKIAPVKGRFKDHFSSWDVHLYRIQPTAAEEPK